MAIDLIQMQPGLSLPNFLALYGSEEACEQALIDAYLGGERQRRAPARSRATVARGRAH